MFWEQIELRQALRRAFEKIKRDLVWLERWETKESKRSRLGLFTENHVRQRPGFLSALRWEAWLGCNVREWGQEAGKRGTMVLLCLQLGWRPLKGKRRMDGQMLKRDNLSDSASDYEMWRGEEVHLQSSNVRPVGGSRRSPCAEERQLEAEGYLREWRWWALLEASCAEGAGRLSIKPLEI